MSDTDEMTVATELRDRAAGLAAPAPMPLEAIEARGRARRRHRHFALAGLCVAGAAGTTALAVGLTGGAAPASTHSTVRAAASSASPHRALPTIRTAAFTIISNRDGTVTLTINPRELFDPTALENDLARDGIAALVTTGKICTSDPAPADISQVESYDPGTPDVDASIIIDPKAMPAGSELSLGTIGLRGGVQASYSSLIDANDYTCTSTPPTDAEQHPAREGVIEYVPTR